MLSSMSYKELNFLIHVAAALPLSGAYLPIVFAFRAIHGDFSRRLPAIALSTDWFTSVVKLATVLLCQELEGVPGNRLQVAEDAHP